MGLLLLFLVLLVALGSVVIVLAGSSGQQMLFIIFGTLGLGLMAIVVGLYLATSINVVVDHVAIPDVATVEVFPLRPPPRVPIDGKPQESPFPAEPAPKDESSLSNGAPTKPGTLPEIPRPSWLDAPLGLDGNTYRQVVSVGPYSTREECESELPDKLAAAVSHYIDTLLTTGAAQEVAFTPTEQAAFVPARHFESRDTSVGPMLWLHALVEIDQADRTRIELRWHTARVHERLRVTGLAVGGVVLVLTVVYLYLRLDRAIRPAAVQPQLG